MVGVRVEEWIGCDKNFEDLVIDYIWRGLGRFFRGGYVWEEFGRVEVF